MTTEVQKWLNEMRRIWLDKDPDSIVNILAEDLEYYEDPFQEPLTDKMKVVSEWQAVKNQNIEFVDIEILHETADNVGVALWRFKEVGSAEHCGSYFLKLDDNGKCTHFRQFWNVKK